MHNRHFLMPEHLLCTQQIHLMYKVEFLPTLIHTEHGNLEVFFAAVLLPLQRAFVVFTFTYNPFQCHSFFPSCLSHFYLSQLSPKQHQIISFFTSLSLTSFVILSITVATKRGVITEP